MFKKVNIYEDTYEKAKDFIEEYNTRTDSVRTFRSMAQLVEEAILALARRKENFLR